MICNFEQLILDPSIEVISDDKVVLLISIPPFTLWFVVCWIGIELLANSGSKSWFSTSSFSMNDDKACLFCLSCRLFVRTGFYSLLPLWNLMNATGNSCATSLTLWPSCKAVDTCSKSDLSPCLVIDPHSLKSFSFEQYSLFCPGFPLALSRCWLDRLNKSQTWLNLSLLLSSIEPCRWIVPYSHFSFPNNESFCVLLAIYFISFLYCTYAESGSNQPA